MAQLINRFSRLLYGVASAAFLLLSANSAISENSYQPAFSITKSTASYWVNMDGTYRQESEFVVRVETPQGIEGGGSRKISYIDAWEEIATIEASTIQQNGATVRVAPDSILTRDEANEGGTSQFSDWKFKTIIFPSVETGSRLYSKYESRTKSGLYPNEFQLSNAFSDLYRFDHWELNIHIPEERKLHVQQRGVSGGLTEVRDGISHYRFTYQSGAAVPPENGLVADQDYLPVLHVSTMATIDEIGRMYYESSRKSSQPTDAIRTLAAHLTEGKSTEAEKARALYNWVAKNIRYVAISFGNSRVVPRKVEDILASRYGDCKDHVAILEALLSSAGIESSPALINQGGAYTLPEIGTLSPLNHVITYLPSLDLYVDATDRWSPFGTLPSQELDKPTLLTRWGTRGKTPTQNADLNVVAAQIKLHIVENGEIRGATSTTYSGQSESRARNARFDNASRPQEILVRELLREEGETGTGFIRSSDPEDLDSPFSTSSEFVLDPVANIPGRGAMQLPMGLSPGLIRSISQSKFPILTDRPRTCSSRTYAENFEIQFPRNVRLDKVPAGTRYVTKNINYRSEYTRRGNTVHVSRKLWVQRSGSVCAKADTIEWMKFINFLQRDIRSQIFYH